MSYVVITPDGEFHHHPKPADSAAIQAALPSRGFDLVRLRVDPHMFAFVDGDGHVVGLPRNPIGACVIAVLGATPHAYCGPVVITGWREPSNSSEVRDLDPAQVAGLTLLHAEIVQVLSGSTGGVDPELAAAAEWLRGYAESVRSAPTPTVHVVDLGGAS